MTWDAIEAFGQITSLLLGTTFPCLGKLRPPALLPSVPALPSSSDARLPPIHLSSLFTEVTACIQLFVKRPFKKHTGAHAHARRAPSLGYIKVISCQASWKHPPPSASDAADWSRHPVWHIWARESNENSCFCPYGIQRLAAWRCAVPTLGKLSIINPGIWPAYELPLIKTSGGGDGGRRRGYVEGRVSLEKDIFCE